MKTLEEIIKEKQYQLKQILSNISELNKQERRLKVELDKLRQKQHLQNIRAYIDNLDFGVNLIAYRKQLIETKRLLQSKDITIREQEDLSTIKLDLERKLKNGCRHPVNIYFRGTSGSRSWDYDDAVQPFMVCVFCNTETDIKTNPYDEPIFNELPSQKTVLICNVIGNGFSSEVNRDKFDDMKTMDVDKLKERIKQFNRLEFAKEM